MSQGLASFLRHDFGEVVKLGLNQTAKSLNASHALSQWRSRPSRLCIARFLRFEGHGGTIVDGQLGDQFFCSGVDDVKHFHRSSMGSMWEEINATCSN